MTKEENIKRSWERLKGALDRVCDEATFCEFLQALAEDWFEEQEIEKVTPSAPYSSGALGWEHGTIGGFLDAAAAYAPDNNWFREANPWQRAAAILLGGKDYE